MNIEWLKNKTKEKFYPITHAKAVLFGENNRTVNDEIEQIKNDFRWSIIIGKRNNFDDYRWHKYLDFGSQLNDHLINIIDGSVVL